MEDKNQLNDQLPEEQLPISEEMADTPIQEPAEEISVPEAAEELPVPEDTPTPQDFVASFFGEEASGEEDFCIGGMPEMEFSSQYAEEMEFATPEDLDDAYFSEDPSVEKFLNEEDDPAPIFSDLDATQLFVPVEDTELPGEPEAEPALSPEEAIPDSDAAVLSEEEEFDLDRILSGVISEEETLPVPMASEPEPAVDSAFRGDAQDGKDFEDMFTKEPKKEKKKKRSKKQPAKAVRKGRPKRKKGDTLFGLPHLAVTAVWLAIIVLIGSTLGKLLWAGAADVLAFGRISKPVTLTITESDDLDSLSLKLKEAGLVKYPSLFKLYIQITDSEDEIITGYFELNTSLDYHALVNSLSPSSSNRTVTEVLIPEGYNCRQIFALLEENHICSVAALEEYAANGQFSDYWFLEDLERGDKYCLEGFLFPDTYQFYVNSTPKEALSKLLSGFDNRFSDEMRDMLPALNERFSAMMRAKGCSDEHIAENQLTIQDLVTIASMIEEETASANESPNIASVIYNRLSGKNAYDRYLNIDASIYYALDGNIDPETGLTKPLTAEDLKLDSPFNTYTTPGLTPTPISNPGLASLQAALDPADTQYYYYVLNPETRLHQFSKTLEEHEKWVEQFRNGG